MKKIRLLIFSFMIFSQLYSQTGPGGVGENDGTSSLVLWLDANTETTGVDGMALSTWHDRSGNGLDFPAGTAASGDGATYNSAGVNGYPTLTFNGSNDYYQHPYSATLNPASISIFSSTNVSSTSTYKSLITSRSSISGSRRGYIIYSRPSNNRWDFWTAQGTTWGNDGNNTSTSGSWASIICEYAPGASNKKLFINQNLDFTTTRSMLLNTTTQTRIGGGHTTAVPQYMFQGDMAEVMIYNAILNTAQKIIIDNYMSAKYNYSLTANNLFNEDDGINGDYDHDVAGIGRIDASNIHDDSQGTGIVRILNPAGLNDTEFLFWGHDNGVQEASETTDVPAPVVARFDRIWRVSEVNTSGIAVDIGAVDIRFDLSGLGAVTPSDLRLLVDADNDGVFNDETPISGATNVSGDIYQFTGVTAITDNLRFTLGSINISQTPLPIELLNFSAKPIDNKSVLLKWQTASEINNEYFTIERSENGHNWNDLQEIDGAGNSSSLLSYSASDKRPYLGVSYYRLKQTDFDGKFEHSEIRSVKIRAENNIKIFPNPAKNQVTITGKDIAFKDITIYNTLGQNVTDLTQQTIENGSQLVIDLSQLSSGIYYIKTKTTANKVYKQ